MERDHQCGSAEERLLRAAAEMRSVAEALQAVLQHATKNDLHEMEKRIMSAISEFAAKQNAFNDRIDAAVSGVQADVAFLQETIDKLQNSVGTITPEDQALLDQLDARTDAVATKLEALDALTPPKPPVA